VVAVRVIREEMIMAEAEEAVVMGLLTMALPPQKDSYRDLAERMV
jgi:hypothetical protein